MVITCAVRWHIPGPLNTAEHCQRQLERLDHLPCNEALFTQLLIKIISSSKSSMFKHGKSRKMQKGEKLHSLLYINFY